MPRVDVYERDARLLTVVVQIYDDVARFRVDAPDDAACARVQVDEHRLAVRIDEHLSHEHGTLLYVGERVVQALDRGGEEHSGAGAFCACGS